MSTPVQGIEAHIALLKIDPARRDAELRSILAENNAMGDIVPDEQTIVFCSLRFREMGLADPFALEAAIQKQFRHSSLL